MDGACVEENGVEKEFNEGGSGDGSSNGDGGSEDGEGVIDDDSLDKPTGKTVSFGSKLASDVTADEEEEDDGVVAIVVIILVVIIVLAIVALLVTHFFTARQRSTKITTLSNNEP